MKRLSQYRRNVTSQFGEDGIIEAIFEKLGIEKGWCVEFGAWDGKLFSNTWNLWHNKGWNAVLIEGDPVRANELEDNVKDYPNVTCIQSFISHEGETSLYRVLKKTNISEDFELLSIDVDGNDFHIWKEFKQYKPKLVIIEHNPTIPPHIEFVDLPGREGMEGIGCSAVAIVKLAKEKGYELVCCTHSNCFFVRRELVPQLEIGDASLEKLFQYDGLTYIVSFYKGHPFLTKHNLLANDPSFVDSRSIEGVFRQIFLVPKHLPDSSMPVLLVSGDLLEKIVPFLNFFYNMYFIFSKIRKKLKQLMSIFRAS